MHDVDKLLTIGLLFAGLAGILSLTKSAAVGELLDTVVGTNTPRGLRNNNPGNIKDFGIRWEGYAGKDDKGFVIFSDVKYGIRAMYLQLLTYGRRGLKTIKDIIPVYAPASENAVFPYIASVEYHSGIDRDQILNTPRQFEAVISAMIQHENGTNPFTPEYIYSAMELA